MDIGSNGPFVVDVSDDHIEYCKRLAKDRSSSAGWRADPAAGERGVIVEFAFQEFHECFRGQFNGRIMARGDGGVDYFTPLNNGIDVKGSLPESRWLLINGHTVRNPSSDIFVFGRWFADSARVTFDGWILESEFQKIAKKDPFNKKSDNYGCWASSLQPMEVLRGSISRSLL